MIPELAYWIVGGLVATWIFRDSYRLWHDHKRHKEHERRPIELEH